MLELLAYLIISTCTTIASTLRYFYISTNDELNHKIVYDIYISLYKSFAIFTYSFPLLCKLLDMFHIDTFSKPLENKYLKQLVLQ
jgi:hypothetical protein